MKTCATNNNFAVPPTQILTLHSKGVSRIYEARRPTVANSKQLINIHSFGVNHLRNCSGHFRLLFIVVFFPALWCSRWQNIKLSTNAGLATTVLLL